MARIFNWIIDNLDFVLTVMIAITVTVLVSLGYIPSNQISITTLGVLISLTLFMAIKNFRLGNKINTITNSLSTVERRVNSLTSAHILSGTEEFFKTLNSLLTEHSRLDVTYFSPTPPANLPGSHVQAY